jgi:hypothetical protein
MARECSAAPPFSNEGIAKAIVRFDFAVARSAIRFTAKADAVFLAVIGRSTHEMPRIVGMRKKLVDVNAQAVNGERFRIAPSHLLPQCLAQKAIVSVAIDHDIVEKKSL